MEQKRMKELQARIRQAEIEDDAFGETEEGKALDARMDFARTMIALLKSQKITQAELCRRINMKPTQMSRIINAEDNVTLPTICRIADGFGIPPSRLFQKPRKARETAGAEK
jgi:antitoxin component HigA of HigAB toxin-antitoxin module